MMESAEKNPYREKIRNDYFYRSYVLMFKGFNVKKQLRFIISLFVEESA